MKRLLLLLLIVPFIFFVSCTEENNSSDGGPYTITFNSDGGTNILSRTVDKGNTLAKPNNPVKRVQERDFIFLGWFTESAHQNEYDFSKPVNQSFTLYAKWIQAVVLTFDSTGGTTVAFQNVEPGKSATAPSNPRRGGFTFNGWFTAATGGTVYNFSSAVTADLTIYAQWEVLIVDDVPFFDLSGKTAIQYFTDRQLTVGWNAGDSLDAPNELAWGNPLLTQELFHGVKEAGFNLVRIPVTWVNTSHPIGAAPDYALDAAFLERVAEVVDMAYNAGLAAIINIHHDGYHSGNDVGWFSIRDARNSVTDRERITAQYVKIWEQIAERFKNYGDWLIFESLNEIHSGNWGWDRPGAPISALEFEILNDWNQKFLDTVRASGGNNALRFLIAKPYCAKPHQVISILNSEDADYGQLKTTFRMPTDTTAGKLILSFHYYDPEPFALRGTNVNWGTDAEKEEVVSRFAHFKRLFVDNGIPVIIGESGATYQLREGNQEAHDLAHTNRKAYMSHLYGVARQNGITPVYWDNGKYNTGGERFGLFNRATGQPWTIGAEIIQAIMNGINGQ